MAIFDRSGTYLTPTRGALEGARQVLMEQFAEDAELVGALREHVKEQGQLVSKVAEGKEEAGAKFRDYFDYREPITAVPSHRALALFRGRKEEILQLALKLPEDLAAELGRNEAARAFFETLNGANRYAILYRVTTVRRPETRAQRIATYVAMLARHETLYP